jgi:hypothetical protein
MDLDEENKRNDKVEEPRVEYEFKNINLKESIGKLLTLILSLRKD